MDEKKESGFTQHVLETFIGKQGRKAAFAIWGFWVANALRVEDKITPEIWWWVFLTCAALIGFGTIVDRFVEKLGDAVTTAAGKKIATIIGAKDVDVPPQPVQP